MLLEKLTEFSARIEQTPSMYKKKMIHWVIDLDQNGRYLNTIKAGDGESKKWKGQEFIAPDLVRTRGIKPILLADNGEYTLAISRGGSEDQALERHSTYLTALEACYAATQEPSLTAILNFLKSYLQERIELHAEFDPLRNVTFRVNGQFPFELPSVQRWWAGHATEKKDAKAETEQECLVCGQQRPALKGHPIQIKGIRGGQATLYMVSANAPAFTSYGLESSLIAPTCQACAEGYAKGLNELLSDSKHHFHINNLAYCFWTREPHVFSILDFFDNPDPLMIKELLKAPLTGKSGHLQTDGTPFYALALSASGARVVVRDWLETTVGEVKNHLANFFRLQQLVNREGQPGYGFGIFRLSASLYREAKDISPNVPRALLSYALKGGVLPKSLLYLAVQRNRAEKQVSEPRAALIRMLLIQHNILKEDQLIMLDITHRDRAYHCGRLLCVLESIQYQALGSVGSSITDRYFGTASSAPASVFGTLLRNAQAHLGKLRKTKEGAHYALQDKLSEVLSQLESFPKTLSLEQQALFSLGYYHQKAADRKAMEERKVAKAEKGAEA
ncbi:MAG: type I-C CRISPR-associated protein Cas8c/Csd1 [Candidatus Melainabacteria bacterium HGW-Melainabacteria-1]|nr:MAG: type I-C CRISPR-associated protein Cas8c/Csd1 [Candidatus Melainabacteria bacterium HGW-Melainabacteria-1]